MRITSDGTAAPAQPVAREHDLPAARAGDPRAPHGPRSGPDETGVGGGVRLLRTTVEQLGPRPLTVERAAA
ncbi:MULTISPECIES: hypothetical protein [Streptomyces]|uniref:hypothetical protein n=1 Tax=Streptomyces TaxID=1883 RepID=UPI001C2771FE|nr:MULTISPECIES: hypothetical protein [Streptomyces]